MAAGHERVIDVRRLAVLLRRHADGLVVTLTTGLVGGQIEGDAYTWVHPAGTVVGGFKQRETAWTLGLGF